MGMSGDALERTEQMGRSKGVGLTSPRQEHILGRRSPPAEETVTRQDGLSSGRAGPIHSKRAVFGLGHEAEPDAEVEIAPEHVEVRHSRRAVFGLGKEEGPDEEEEEKEEAAAEQVGAKHR